jgi:hypothetical protein
VNDPVALPVVVVIVWITSAASVGPPMRGRLVQTRRPRVGETTGW